MDRDQLNQRIRRFYDASSGLWEQIWGEHMHHGYYEPDQPHKDRRQAQIDLIQQLLNWAEVTSATHILDVGCGIGGSTLELAQRYQATVTGISLSPWQVKRAQARAKAQGLQDQTHFQVADALTMPFPDQQFDLVWSLESGEHMPDKTQFLQECLRVLKPGGRLILATWCHRPEPRSAVDQRHLQRIYDVYCLPYVISLPEYIQIVEKLGLMDLKSADWSTYVAPFWNVVIDSALDWRVVPQLFQAGWETIRAALSLRLMSRGFASGLIRYGLLTGIKPAMEE
ncbi:MAG: methyltransferase domain-containing protein [Synechococcaceae cyanobacterium SM2_3_1]|nr:methyltransferase domain-containing protein [Synechococcaceae cyanobacterium SM2_3_1]